MILGTSERSTLEVKNQSLKKEKNLRKYSSFMSVTISEADSGVHKDGDLESERSPQQLHSQPSSPLLGHQYANGSPDWDSATEFFGMQHRSQSSSTLQSYYDSSKSPLNISQQTSASSARDMALRKGKLLIGKAPGQDISDAINAPKKKDRKRAKENLGALTRRHPRSDFHLDLSSLYQIPHTSDRFILSPNKVVRSPSEASLASNLHQPVQGSRTKWFSWERKKSKASIPEFIPNSREVLTLDESVRSQTKPSTQKSFRAYRNWFNDISEEDNIPEGHSQYLVRTANSKSTSPKCNDDVESHRIRRSKSNNGDFSHDSKLSCTTIKSLPSVVPVQPATDLERQRAQFNETQRTSSNDSQKSEPSRKHSLTIILSETDLHSQSFLALTSSEDESEDRFVSEATKRRHRIRASIEKADTGDEVLVCSAERVQPIKPRPVVNRPRRKAESFKNSDMIPLVPSIPSKPQPNPRVSSMKWKDEMKLPPAGTMKRDTPDHSREGSVASRSASQLSQISSLKTIPIRGSKMMVVTVEEEKLLEAMRRKRASIRQEALADQTDDTNQIYNSNTISRPRTAGADGRPRPCSYFDIHKSASSPPQTDIYAKYADTPSYAASAGDMSGEDSSPLPSPSSFPQTPAAFSFDPSMSKATPIRRPPKKATPSLSFSPSDLLPSPPAMSDATGEEINGTVQCGSRTSPVTPPPGHVLDVYESELAIAVSHPRDPALYLNKRSHDRKRAINSNVFVINDIERESQEVGVENGITDWAMSKW